MKRDLYPMKDIIPTVIGMIITAIVAVGAVKFVTSYSGL